MPKVLARDYELFFEEQGQGPPIIFLHSLACDHTMFSAQAKTLSKKYRTLNFDFPGHGQSAGPESIPWTLEGLAADLLSALDRLHLKSAHWVGLSVGAMLSLRCALMRPELVKSLVLMNSTADSESPEKKQKYLALAGAVRAGQLNKVLEPILQLFFSEQTRLEKPDLVRAWTESLLASNAEGLYQAAQATFERTSVLDQLKNISAKTLVLRGEFDLARTLDESSQMTQGIRGAQMAIVPRAAHLSALEEAESSTQMIAEFLDT